MVLAISVMTVLMTALVRGMGGLGRGAEEPEEEDYCWMPRRTSICGLARLAGGGPRGGAGQCSDLEEIRELMLSEPGEICNEIRTQVYFVVAHRKLVNTLVML